MNDRVDTWSITFRLQTQQMQPLNQQLCQQQRHQKSQHLTQTSVSTTMNEYNLKQHIITAKLQVRKM